MKKMTPREALYYMCIALGPVVPQTNRDDNLSPDQVRLRDAVKTLQNFIEYHDDKERPAPKMSVEDFVAHHSV